MNSFLQRTIGLEGVDNGSDNIEGNLDESSCKYGCCSVDVTCPNWMQSCSPCVDSCCSIDVPWQMQFD